MAEPTRGSSYHLTSPQHTAGVLIPLSEMRRVRLSIRVWSDGRVSVPWERWRTGPRGERARTPGQGKSAARLSGPIEHMHGLDRTELEGLCLLILGLQSSSGVDKTILIRVSQRLTPLWASFARWWSPILRLFYLYESK